MPLAVDQWTETIVAAKRMLRSQLPNRAEVFAEVEAHVRRRNNVDELRHAIQPIGLHNYHPAHARHVLP